jgi:CRISPR-associated protein (TIGR03984 family)
MPNEMHETLDECLISQHLGDVTEKKSAWILLQEPGFIGFGVVQQNKIWWPPNMPQSSPDWTRIGDLRLFGEKGEWHVWPHWDGTWQSRLLKSEEMTDTLTEYHALWGNDVESDTPPWIRLVEERGVEIWLPLAEFNLKSKSDLPLRLKLKQIVDYDPDSHLAGIIDAALIGLVRSSDKELLLPTNLSPCS